MSTINYEDYLMHYANKLSNHSRMKYGHVKKAYNTFKEVGHAAYIVNDMICTIAYVHGVSPSDVVVNQQNPGDLKGYPVGYHFKLQIVELEILCDIIRDIRSRFIVIDGVSINTTPKISIANIISEVYRDLMIQTGGHSFGKLNIKKLCDKIADAENDQALNKAFDNFLNNVENSAVIVMTCLSKEADIKLPTLLQE